MEVKKYWLGVKYALHLLLYGGDDMPYTHLGLALAMLQRIPGVRHMLREKIRIWALILVVKTTNHSAANAREKASAYIQLTWAHIRAHAPRKQIESALSSAHNQLPWIVVDDTTSRLEFASILAQIADLCIAVGGVYTIMAPEFYANAIREAAAAKQNT